MNKDDVIRMADEAGAGYFGGPYRLLGEKAIEHFAALVAAAAIKDAPDYKMGYADGVAAERIRFSEECIDLVASYGGPVDLEAAIRARGNQS